MDLNTKRKEFKELLADVYVHLRHETDHLDYQNLCNDPNRANDATVRRNELLVRCEHLLAVCFECEAPTAINSPALIETVAEPNSEDGVLRRDAVTLPCDSSYLDMTSKMKKRQMARMATTTNDYVFINLLDDDNLDSTSVKPTSSDVYDVCGGSNSATIESVGQPQASVKLGADETNEDCPFLGLPAAHLDLKRSPQRGHLLRLEKRMFFGQSKKYFCGIVDDWLLCYNDGSNSIRPTMCLQLTGTIEVEHYGDGRRRDFCFQLANVGPTGKRYVFQASSEIDAKIWIHAIESVIRGDHLTVSNDSTAAAAKSQARKLPTPPMQLKVTDRSVDSRSSTDEIYEEPCPLYETNVIKIASIVASMSPVDTKTIAATKNAQCQEYDVPKRPVLVATAAALQSDRPKTPPAKDVDKMMPPTQRQQLSPSSSHITVTSKQSTLESGESIKTTMPVRNWFLGRRGGTAKETPSNLRSAVQQPSNKNLSKIRTKLRPTDQPLSTVSKNPSSRCPTLPEFVKNKVLVATARGEKVNKIVSQLVDATSGAGATATLNNNARQDDFECGNVVPTVMATKSKLTAIRNDANYELIQDFNNYCKT